MKKLLILLFIAVSTAAIGQTVNCTVVDSSNGQPLMYASVFFKMTGTLQYSGEDGIFSFNKDSVSNNDTIIIGYVGYNDFSIPVNKITDGIVIRMQNSGKQLQAVIVTNCKKYKTITVNKPKGRIDQFTGPGPETKIILISRFANTNDIHGYIKNINIYAGSFDENAKVPVRIHWYKWNETLQQPGEELTDRNLIIYPYKKGWNQFAMPDKLFWYSKDGFVLGLEFIYPVDFVKQYTAITSSKEKIKWLQQMQNRWSLGMNVTDDNSANTFYMLNNSAMQPYKKAGYNLYLQPAVKFDLQVCKKG